MARAQGSVTEVNGIAEDSPRVTAVNNDEHPRGFNASERKGV